MKIVKIIAIFLSALFIGIVLIERIPGVLVPTNEQYEWPHILITILVMFSLTQSIKRIELIE